MAFLLFIGVFASAQTGYYQFSAGTDVLAVQPGTGVTTLVAGASADGVSALHNIGFTVNYAGTAYTQLSASANGLIRLGPAVVTLESVNNFTSITNVPKLMGFWDDMATGNVASLGGVRTWTVGVAPNRKKVVDFKLASNDLTTSAYDLQFQVWIFETTGLIEYVYGSGPVAGMSASIGLGGATATQYLSVTPGGPATASNAAANNAVAANPGNGVKYTFTPPVLSGIKTVGAGMDYPTLAAAVSLLNWVGPGAGGVTFNISGGHVETVAAGSLTPNPDVPAGLCITANGTAANPIIIKWDGVGVKPVFKAGAGIGNFDFVIGICGGDYITLDGLEIQDDNVLNTTNAKRAEIGIGLFKRLYNTTLGNDGCGNVTVKNCKITLTRDPNAIGNYAYCQDNYFSAGIKASAFTSTHQGATNFFEGGNPNGGIKTQNDVHRNCVIIGNAIDNCTFGITFADRWAEISGNVYAGAGNIIGQLGAGNTITNWGLKAGSAIDYGINESDMGRVVAGIAIGGQKDYTIEYNTITTCGTNTGNNDLGPVSYCGILAGTGSDGNSWPHFAAGFFAKITHNTVSGIDLLAGTNVAKAAYGISFAQFADHVTNTNLTSRPATGNVDITFNDISNIKVNRGDCHGISCKYYYEAWRHAVYTDDRTGGFQSSGSVTINNNTIKSLTKRTGSSADWASEGTFSAIYWMHGQNNLYIDNNVIGGAGADGLVRGSATHAFIARNLAGSRMIWANAHFPRGARSLVQVNNNTITNVDQIANPTMAVANNWSVGFSGIFVDNGGLTNNIQGNTITGCDIGSGARNSGYEEALAFIFVNGKSRTGLSTVNVSGNNLLKNSRTLYRYCYTNHGASSFTAGIYSKYNATGQIKNIYNNVIDGLTGVATVIPTPNTHAYWARIEGIKVLSAGNINTTVVSIHGNTIKNLGGDTYSYNHTLTTTSYDNYHLAFNTIGINANRFHRVRIYKNSVCNLSTTSAGYPGEVDYPQGVAGIIFGSDQYEYAPVSTLSDPKMAVYDNFVGQLSAPAMRSRLAVVGLFLWGYTQDRVIAHNTVVLGSTTGAALGRLSSTTTGAFGVTGYLNFDYNVNYKPAQTLWSNNIVSINADCKGTGMGTAWRHYALSGIKKMWLGTETSSSGNVYFVNDDANNYIYGQGIDFGITGGVRNCYGYGTSVTTNATHNMVNDNVAPKNFNDICGKYKSFMGGREKGSFIDLSPGNVMQPLPFTNTGGCEAEMTISNGANSYVGSAKRMQMPFDIATDFYGTVRGTPTVTAGAHENNANISGPIVNLIDFAYDPACNGVCTGNKTIDVTITPPSGKTIATAANKVPRLYFRRIQNASVITAAQSDNNVMVNAANNTAIGTEGWRWVEATTVAGGVYTFTIDEALLRATIVTTPTYTVEYFVIAETSDGTVCNWSSGDFSAFCPATVDLFSISGATAVPADDDGDTGVALNSVEDNYSVYAGASLTKKIQLINDGLAAKTTNMTVAFPVCTGDEIRLNGQYSVTATGQRFDPGCISYKMEVADNSTFTLGLQSFIQSDSVFTYTMAAAGTKYFRIWLNCGGTNVLNSNTTYLFVTASDMPVNTSVVPAFNSCVGVAQNITVTSSTPTVSKNYWVVNPYGKVYVNPPVSTTALSQVKSVNPADTTESGTWHTYVTLAAGATLTDQGIKSADYFDGVDYSTSGADVDTTRGVAFHTNSFIKLNSISVLDDPTDGVGSAGFNISLYSKSGKLIYKTAAQSTTDAQLKPIVLTNWYIPPGDYMIVMGASVLGVEPTGGLAIVGATFPVGIANTSTSGLDLLGGVSGLDFDGFDESSNNYFLDWDVTIFCTSMDMPFSYIVNPASCCAVTTVGLIANGTTSADLVTSNCSNFGGNWIYYFDPAVPSKLLCAVNPNGNPWNPTTMLVYNSGASSDTDHLVTDGVDATEVMPYMLQMENGDALTVNGGVKIRMFYPAAQKTIIDAYTNKTWFKFESDKQGVLNAMTPAGLIGKQNLVPDVTGTENSIPFVEFHNITSSSTFGFVGANCTGTATITETDTSCAANDGNILVGGSATLTASGGVSYVWDDASTLAVRSVNPLVTTTYTVTVTDANGCTVTETSTVTIVAAPIAAIAETDASCASNDGKVLSGAAATLTASGGATYSWDDASTAAIRVVNPVANTTYLVTVTDINGCTNTGSTTVMVVTAPTGAIASADNSCFANDEIIAVGGSATLTASGGLSYTWDDASTSAVRMVSPVATTIYEVTLTDANGCTATANKTITVIAFCGVSVASRVFLGAVYDTVTMQMNDNLRSAGLIPLAQPYGGAEYPDIAHLGTETTTAPVLSITGSNAIVDWVIVEIRDSINPVTVLARKAALLQRDGDIVDVDGVSALLFTGINAGNYFVAVRHRNHLGVMTQTKVALSPLGSTIDFTLAATPNYQLSGATGSIHAQQSHSGGKRSLWAGNTSNTSSTGDRVIYQGPNSDVDEIYFKVLLDVGNLMFLPNYMVTNTYTRMDANLDGAVVYQGSGSDSDVAFFSVLFYPLNTTSLPNYTFFEQIPK